MERYFAPIFDNTEKQRTYAEQLKRFQLAVKYDFYADATMIVYAMLEDRLRAWLYYIGALKNRNDTTCKAKQTKNQLRALVASYKESDIDKTKLTIINISQKMDIILSSLQVHVENMVGYPDDKYLVLLSKKYEKFDLDIVLSKFDQINIWCKHRNELVHGLLNKNMDDYHAKIRPFVEEGMLLARWLDNTVRQLKSGISIRKKINLNTDK